MTKKNDIVKAAESNVALKTKSDHVEFVIEDIKIAIEDKVKKLYDKTSHMKTRVDRLESRINKETIALIKRLIGKKIVAFNKASKDLGFLDIEISEVSVRSKNKRIEYSLSPAFKENDDGMDGPFHSFFAMSRMSCYGRAPNEKSIPIPDGIKKLISNKEKIKKECYSLIDERDKLSNKLRDCDNMKSRANHAITKKMISGLPNSKQVIASMQVMRDAVVKSLDIKL